MERGNTSSQKFSFHFFLYTSKGCDGLKTMLSPTSRILDPAAPAPCSRVVAISEAILKEKDLGALAIFLNSIQLEEESDVIEDLRQWLPVLDNFDGLLAVLCQQIVTTGTSTEETILQTQFENSEYDVKLVLCSILYFLRGLMKRGKEKRCFLSYKVCKAKQN